MSIQIVGGPFDGTTHDLVSFGNFGWPSKIGLPDENGMHWYEVHYEIATATFLETTSG